MGMCKTVWLLLVLTLLTLPLAVLPGGEAAAQESNPRADYWREVRKGIHGYSAVKGQETDVLIQTAGQNWRQLRNGPVANYGAWFLGGVVAAIVLFYLLRGQARLDKGRSGMTMVRWRLWERILHWTTAVLFIILAVTGMSLLFGRAVLIPLLGKSAFAAWAELAKLLHNTLGPVFLAGILMEFLAWVRHNIPKRHDWIWFKQGGGIVGHKHPPAGRMNGGEKVWFWLIFFVGLLLVGGTGLILDFPNYGQNRDLMQTAHLLHAVGAFIFVAFAIGHIYIGTLGTEGALEGMTRGRVDMNWAKQHHDIWFEEEMAKPRARRDLEDERPIRAGPGHPITPEP